MLGQLPASAADSPDNFPATDVMLSSMLMLGFRGQTLDSQEEFHKLATQGLPCGVILFDRDVATNAPRNISSPQQLQNLTRELRKAAKAPIFISVDQEGGQVRRLKVKNGFMDLPSAQRMGQGNVEATLETAENLGSELKEAGINVDLAPVVDVDTNPYNPAIGKLGRAFGPDATQVTAHALAFGRGLAKKGVIPVLKHFPGQGCAANDTHLEGADVSQCWDPNIDLLPYAEIFRAGWPGMVMTGHIRVRDLDPDLPATLSRNIVTGLLREGLGWQGVVISDDLQMKAVSGGRTLKEIIRLAIDAGNDILLFGNNLDWDPDLPGKIWQALRDLQDEGSLTVERIRQSWQRIDTLRNAYGIQ